MATTAHDRPARGAPAPVATGAREPLRPLTAIAVAAGVLSTLALGVWAFAAPGSFATALAPWADYGEHFVRDGGAFKIGIGLFVLLAARWRDVLDVMLASLAASSALHALSHAIDRDWLAAVGLALVAAVAAAALVDRRRSRRVAVTSPSG